MAPEPGVLRPIAIAVGGKSPSRAQSPSPGPKQTTEQAAAEKAKIADYLSAIAADTPDSFKAAATGTGTPGPTLSGSTGASAAKQGTGRGLSPSPQKHQTQAGSDADKFHLFTWADSKSSAAAPGRSPALDPLADNNADRSSLDALLGDLDEYLNNGTRKQDKLVYSKIKEAKRANLHAYLGEVQTILAASSEKRNPKNLEDRIDIFNAADIVFRFYLPGDFVGPTTGKFWGAIKAFVAVRTYPLISCCPCSCCAH